MGLRYITILCTAVIFTACSKSGSERETNNSELKIKRIIYSYTGSHEADIEDFTYDSDGRLLTWNYRSEDSAATPLITYQEFNTFYYNGSDDKPVKDSAVYITGSVGTTMNTSFYNYDAQNRIVQYMRSENGGDWMDKHVITYNADNVTQENYYNYNTTVEQKDDSAKVDGEGRIYSVKQYSYPGPSLYFTSNITFDTKNNPYHALNIFKYLYDINADLNERFQFAKNNILTYTTVYNNITGYSTHTYTYNSNDFPVTGTYLHGTDTGGVSYSTTVSYEYY